MLHAPMLDLYATYEQLTRPWSHEQLAAHYRDAKRRGAQTVQHTQKVPDRPISLLATGIPASASVSVAIHVLHALPTSARGELAQHLVNTAGTNAADLLHRCHLALELDGRAHDYAAHEWLPVIYDVAAPLLLSARLDREPPSVVQHAQDAVHGLASAVINLDQDSTETPAALADALGHLLIVCVFADAARDHAGREPNSVHPGSR
ncbi:MAG: hypothetical protein ABI427_00270 [Solirubrobacteraceae bacterium]